MRIAVAVFCCWTSLAPAEAEMPTAGAASGLSVTADLKGIVLNEAGEELVVESNSVKVGGVVEYRAVYMNTGDRTLRNVRAELPIPPGTTRFDQDPPTDRRVAVIDATALTVKRTETMTATDDPHPIVVNGDGERQSIVWQIRALEPGESTSVSVRLRLLVPGHALLQPDDDVIRNSLVITTTL